MKKHQFIVLAIDQSSFVYVWTNEGWTKVSSIAIPSTVLAWSMSSADACAVRDNARRFGTVRGVKYHILPVIEGELPGGAS